MAIQPANATRSDDHNCSSPRYAALSASRVAMIRRSLADVAAAERPKWPAADGAQLTIRLCARRIYGVAFVFRTARKMLAFPWITEDDRASRRSRGIRAIYLGLGSS